MSAPRLLSSWPARRLGPQLPLDVQNGRAQREHAQSWSDHQPTSRSERFNEADRIAHVVIVLVALAVGFGYWIGRAGYPL